MSKNNKDVDSWSKGFNKMFEEKQKVDNMLSPSKGEINYIKSYAKSIEDSAATIDLISKLAHEGIVDFEKAQEILTYQKSLIKKDIEYLKSYLDIPEEELV